MRTRKVDIAIVGAGTAGLNAVREARDSGRSWLLIDPGPYGTTCARSGCMPSKLLIAAAEAAHQARNADTFGVRVGQVEVDGAAVLARVRRERDRFVAGVVDEVEALPARNRLLGRARFVDADTLEISDGSRVQAGALVVATGSRPVVPGPLRGLGSRLLTSESLFELQTLPRSVAVIGTGLVGLELGQALQRLGVAVTFIDRSEHVGPCTDPEVVAAIEAQFQRELQLEMDSEVSAAEVRDGDVVVTWKRADGQRASGTFDAVLAAAGRPPALADLNLQATGLPLDDDGMPPWDPATTQCGDAPIFLAGDVNGHQPLLHEAGDEGRISGANAASWPRVARHRRRAPLTVIFTDPQIAMVGTTYEELDAREGCIGSVSFEDQGRARVMARNHGTLRVYGRRGDCALLGAEMVGPHMEHLAHVLAAAVQDGLSVQRLLQMPVYHPTLEEGMRSALRELARELGVTDQCRRQDMSRAPGM